MAARPPITLYRLQACPYCERVVRVLEELELDYESRFVEPLHSRRDVVARLTNKRTVPAMVDRETGVTMSESANIVDYLRATYDDGGHAGAAAQMNDFDVVTLEPADPVPVGERAPDVTRPLVDAEYWQDSSLADLTDDGPVLLVFHPMDGAFPTTSLWQEVADRGWGDRLRVVGVSISDPYAHKQLVQERGLADGDYALYADPDNGIARAFGVAHDLDGMASIEEPRPAVFLLDRDRTVRYAWAAETWPEFPDYDAVGAAIDDLLAEG